MTWFGWVFIVTQLIGCGAILAKDEPIEFSKGGVVFWTALYVLGVLLVGTGSL